jgi:hypothetical protein
MLAGLVLLLLVLAGVAAYQYWPAIRNLAGLKPGSAIEAPATPAPPPEKKAETAVPAVQAEAHPPLANQAAPKSTAPIETGAAVAVKKTTARPAEATAPPVAVIAPQPVVRVLPPTTVTVAVGADRAWTDTGIDLRAGDTAAISAEGKIRVSSHPSLGLQQPAGFSPNCSVSKNYFGIPTGLVPAPQLFCWSLIGRVGPRGTIFEIGKQGVVPAGSVGRLKLGVNDDDFSNNSGAWTAVIHVEHH